MATRTNATTQAILRHLNHNGFVAWRNNNGAVYSVKRKTFLKNPTAKKGVFDIIGFRKSDGKHLEIEIKTGRDKMSEEQIQHRDKMVLAGCISLVVKDYDEYEEYFNKMLKQ